MKQNCDVIKSYRHVVMLKTLRVFLYMYIYVGYIKVSKTLMLLTLILVV